jgi:OmcA/MtrC family decaheme c-type cytochrome
MMSSFSKTAQWLHLVLLLLLFAACGGDGPAGAPGATALTETSDEPPGANCVEGGTRIDVGIDDNRNGQLDDSEVMSTTYVCNGSGKNALVKTSSEPVGDNCAFGGTRIETGLDANNNGTLDASEVDAAATSFVCNFGPSGAISPSTGINIVIKSKSTSATAPIVVRFTMRDDKGFPLDINGVYSGNTPLQPRFGLGYFTKDANGIVSPLTMYTKSPSSSVPAGQPTMYNPKGSAPGHGTFVENGLGAGDYTYTFPTANTANGPFGVAYDATKLGETHVLWVQVTRQTDLVYQANANTFFAANKEDNFIPSGVGTPGRREIVAQSGCDNCHAKFRAEVVSSDQFHGGGRVAVGMCNVCHNPARVSNPLADSASFVHRIHNGRNVATANQFHGIAATYPQDIRNCDSCHKNAAQGDQWSTNPSTLACKGCHDYVSFTNSEAITCGIMGSLARGPDGKPLPCNHVAGPQPDSSCESCHGPTRGFATARYHKPVASPDPNNAWKPGGTNNNTHASFVAAVGYVPPGAAKITYDVKTVEAVADAGGIKRPQITFKLKSDGTDVVFQTYQAGVTTELMPNFVGSPSVYFAFGVPQDNLAASADFNASVSGYIKKIWDGTATGNGAGTLTGPDATGYYTIRLTGVQIPTTATHLTGGLGYSYSLSSTPPLVQTNVPDYPWTPNVPADGRAQGGLSVPAPNVWKVATGFTARRQIVDNNKCNACHGLLGVEPNFHAGQRNDGPTCSFCHTPNRASAGWSAGSKYFVHAVHAGRKRTVDFTWHAASQTENFGEIEFPATLNQCTNCHVANTYDFMNGTNQSSLANQPLTTVASGTYNNNPLVNSSYYTLSPYVIADGVTSYGSGFSYNAATNATTQAAGTTLVISPITGACAACHDSSIALDHMTANGGRFYTPRSLALAPGASQEQCLICHGPGKVAPIGEVHQR